MSRLALFALLFASASSATVAAVTVIDDSGAHIALSAPAARIVSLSPGATEMLFAAGAGGRVIATVEYSDEPVAARQVPRIGDVAAIDIEKLLALRPDVAVIWPGGGNAAQIERIARLGLPLYRQQVGKLADLPASLRRLGALAGTQAVANSAASALDARLAALAARYAGSRQLTVLLEVWNRPIYTVGRSQLMNDALRLCGATNVFGDLPEQGPAVELEAVIARDPDAIVAAAPSGSAQSWLDEWKRFPRLRAVRSGRLIPFEDDRFSRLGPSAIAATEELCRLLAVARTGPG